MKFRIYKAKDGIRWQLISRKKIMAESGEAYKRHYGCMKALKRVMEFFTEGQVTLVDEVKDEITTLGLYAKD
jgi:uncharacterized protein YegP (UPF0339 family)